MKGLIFGICIVSYVVAFSQADTVVIAKGKIFDVQTKESVTAKITYQSLPYGNRIGTLNNTMYSFPMFDNERYSITVEAIGYSTVKYMLDPAEVNSQNQIIKDIELTHLTGKAETKHEVGKVLRLDNLIFEVAKSKIDPDSYTELDLVVNMMNENANMVIQLEGHTDYLGDPAKNLKLSEQRVDAVRDYLISKGIPKKRVKLKAFGGTQPLSRDNTPEGHRLNRRVELRILQS